MEIHPLKIFDQSMAKITGTDSDLDMIREYLGQLKEFEVITDKDQQDMLTTKVTLMSLIFSRFIKSDYAKSIIEECTASTNLLTAYLDHDSTFLKAKQIIYDLQSGIVKGGAYEKLVQKAMDDIGALPFQDNDFDGTLLMNSVLQIAALKAATQYLQLLDQGKLDEVTDDSIVKTLASDLLNNGFNKHKILTTFLQIENDHSKFNGDTEIQIFLLLVIFGLGLLLKPDATPALEPLQQRLIKIKGLTPSQFLSTRGNNTPVQPSYKTGDQIVAEFRELVAKDGYSDYAFNLALTEIKKLPTGTDNEYSAFNKAMDDLITVAKQYAPANYTEALEILRSGMKNMTSYSQNPGDKVTIKEAKEICEANLMELKKNLANGQTVEAAYTQIMIKYQELAARLPEANDEDNEVFAEMMKMMMIETFKALKDYVPEDKKELWPQLYAMMEAAAGGVDLMDAPETEQMVYARQLENQFDRVIYSTKNVPLSPLARATPILQQFIELCPQLEKRFIQMEYLDDSEDAKKYKRLVNQLDDTFRLLSSAYTMDQILQHQKINLRRMVLELNQFERREFLMVANPVFPANEVGLEANGIFFSGSAKVGDITARAALGLEMKLATGKTVDNYVNSRWQQLRESGIAVFDYTEFNPKKADPPGELDHSPEAESKVLKAAGKIADVAYENGWAYALGKPVIIVAAKKQFALPFDIDIDPVIIRNDEGDIEKMMFAVQTSLYGESRAGKGTCLADTIDYVKQQFSGVKNKNVVNLLEAMNNTHDATSIRLSIESVLERMGSENQMLIIPAFPGSYPEQDQNLVFHVTAFRPWSVATQDVLKSLCRKRNFQYKIGYERLNPAIMASIWKDISQSAFVVADITNLNPNAVLELGMAQALGRPVLIITQNKLPHKYFKAIQKTRTHYYDSENSNDQLIELFENFFDGKE